MENILLKEAIIMANSNNMCRLCLSANGITEPICYDQRDQFLLQKIYECTTLQIAPLNGIPSSLCTICKARLDEFYQFRWQCIKNDEIIRRIADNFQKPPTAATIESASQNPKQEVIESNLTGELQVLPPESSSEYNNDPEQRRNEERKSTPISYSHPEQAPDERSDHPGYNLGDHHPTPHGHDQYNAPEPSMDPVNTDHTTVFEPEAKYPVPHAVANQFEYSDFRRKRGRPPKQKYDQYHHHPPIVKYNENSIDGLKPQSSVESSNSRSMVEGPESILTYGDSAARSADYQQDSSYGWASAPKIKLEQMDNQHVRYEDQQQSSEMHDLDRDLYMKLPSTSTVQTVLTSDVFVKRSRGRPPREGGCPNQDRTEYRFQCQYCEARFKAAINLKLHTNTHTGERPYKCQLCDKSFAHPSNLSVHTKLHSQERIKRDGIPSEKKFQCPYCHTLFALAFQLKIHINTHTGQKPYVCKNCGKGFAQPSNLHVHVKKHCHKRADYEPQRTGLAPQATMMHPAVHQQTTPSPPAVQQQQQQPHYQPITIQQHHHAIPLVVSPSSHEQHSPNLQTAQVSEVSVSNHIPMHAQPQHHSHL